MKTYYLVCQIVNGYIGRKSYILFKIKCYLNDIESAIVNGFSFKGVLAIGELKEKKTIIAYDNNIKTIEFDKNNYLNIIYTDNECLYTSSLFISQSNIFTDITDEEAKLYFESVYK